MGRTTKVARRPMGRDRKRRSTRPRDWTWVQLGDALGDDDRLARSLSQISETIQEDFPASWGRWLVDKLCLVRSAWQHTAGRGLAAFKVIKGGIERFTRIEEGLIAAKAEAYKTTTGADADAQLKQAEAEKKRAEAKIPSAQAEVLLQKETADAE